MIENLQAALDRSTGEYTIEDVMQGVQSGDVRLWMGRKSTAATETARIMHVWLAGGDMRELLEMLAGAEAEHRARGFDQITISDARSGWARVLKSHGYVERTVLVKEL